MFRASSDMPRRACQLRLGLRAAALAAICFFAPQSAIVLAQTAAQGPDLTIGAKQFPDQDAVILRWEHHYTLEKDGAVRVRDHRWVKLLTRRAIGRFADPRISYNEAEDKLTVHAARTILPDGEVLEVPDYSFNLAGPDDVAGWPAYAPWRDKVISFSGIVSDCVLELDYEITTRPGVLPWLEGDLRLNDDYPVVERIISVTVPSETKLRFKLTNVAPNAAESESSTAEGVSTQRWTFKDLPPAPAEPQSWRWEKRCPRLTFTTCAGADAWVSSLLKRVQAAAESDERIKKFAETAVEKETDTRERIRKIVGKLKDSFNHVGSPKSLRTTGCRSAGDVFLSNYGNSLEAAAVLGAALKSLGLEVTFALGVDGESWQEEAPTLSTLAGVVVQVATPNGPTMVQPQFGIFDNPGGWGRHWLLSTNTDGKLGGTYIEARGEKAPSEINITGKITIAADGKASGDLVIRLTGVFYNPMNLETSAAQEALIKGIAGRILTGATLKSHSVTELSPQALRAKVSVASADVLKSYDKKYLLPLGDGPAMLPEFALPLARSYRRTDVRISGPVREDIDVAVELPEAWEPAMPPRSLEPVRGEWGSVSQKVDVDGRVVRFQRSIDIARDAILARDFAALRDAINQLRTDPARLLIAGPAEETKPAPSSEEPAASKG